MEKELSRGMPSLFVALLITVGLPLHSETRYVSVDGSGFAPASLTVQAGDTVVWENVDDEDFPHTTTSTLGIFDPNYWDGYLVSLGETFARTFNNVGTFNYIDKVGVGTGTIIVSPGVVTPVINLVSPRMAGGQFLFEATGLTTGKVNVLLSSTNLSDWVAVSTNTAASGSIAFTNAAVFGGWYYRVVELP